MTKEKFLELSTEEQIEAYNEWCEERNYGDDLIKENDLDEFLEGYSPQEVAQEIENGEYDYGDVFITWQGDGTIQTISVFDVEDYILDRMDFEEE